MKIRSFNPRQLLIAYVLVGGCAAFVLRLIQNLTAFESATGLPIPGHPASLALPVLLAALCIGLFPLAFRFSHNTPPVFPFHTDRTKILAVCAAGSLLTACAGAADLIHGQRMLSELSERGFISRSELVTHVSIGILLLITGAVMLCSGVCLFCAAASCRANARPLPGVLLLPAPIAVVMQLVTAYRLDSINPVLESYAVELTAMAFLSAGYYSLSAFAFGAGDLTRFSMYVGGAVILCMCSLADQPSLPALPLLFLGSALVLLGFLILCLSDEQTQLSDGQTEPFHTEQGQSPQINP